MTRGIVAAIAALLMIALPAAAATCHKSTATEPELCPLHLAPITAVHIRENAAVALAEADDPVNCAEFHVDAAEVRRFFAHAEATQERAARPVVGWSPCYASGSLKFADGRWALWSIHQYKSGSLAVVGGDRYFVYCPECAFRPFE